MIVVCANADSVEISIKDRGERVVMIRIQRYLFGTKDDGSWLLNSCFIARAVCGAISGD
jgi:hypothetical protein